MKIQFKLKGVNFNSKRAEKFFNIVLKNKRNVKIMGIFNKKIGIMTLNLMDLIIAIKKGAFLSNKFKNKWNKTAINVNTKKLYEVRY